jgi:hypothetical protein
MAVIAGFALAGLLLQQVAPSAEKSQVSGNIIGGIFILALVCRAGNPGYIFCQ